MSGKTSLIIVGILLVAITVFVYKFSMPKEHMHLAPVVGESIEKSPPAKDTAAIADTASKK